MSIQRWWEERLRARDPVGHTSVPHDGYNIKLRPASQDPWPKAVARSALLDDYRFWFEDTCIAPLKNLPQYAGHPEKLPTVKDPHTFFLTIKPWIYIDKKRQVKNYWVFEQTQHEGRWLKVKVRRWFVRLREWDEHAEAFMIDTGVDVRPSIGRHNDT